MLQDADLELDLKDSKEIYDIILNDKSIDCIFGSRYLSGKLKRHNYFINELAGKFNTFLFNLFFGQSLSDIHCGLKVFKREVCEKIDLHVNDFGLEIELWKVDDSLPAPKFNIVSKPNDWSKTVSSTKKIGSSSVSETKQKQFIYWQQFKEFMIEKNSTVKPTKPHPQHWMSMSVGKSGFTLATTLNSVEKKIGVELYIENDKDKVYFDELEKNKELINSKIGNATWMRLEERKASRIVYYKTNEDPLDENRWEQQHQWLVMKLNEFNNCFRPLLNQIF